LRGRRVSAHAWTRRKLNALVRKNFICRMSH